MPGKTKRAGSRKPTSKRPRAAPKKPAPKRRATGASAKAGISPAEAARRIDKLIAGLRDWRGERLAEVRALIHEADPDVVEDWKWMGTPVWSHDGMYANADPFKDKVKVTFAQGAHLPDPAKLFNAGLTGNRWRAIDLREGDRLDPAAFKALVRAAIAHNGSHAVPKSRGSRDI